MLPRLDIVGQRFGSLVVVQDDFEKLVSASGRSSNYVVVVRCDCGTAKTMWKAHLKRTKSCGCMTSEMCSEANKTHGMSKSRIYHSWCLHMREGVVCKRWESLEKLIEDTGAAADARIVRVNKTKLLSPRNYKLNHGVGRLITINGQEKNLKGWSIVLGVSRERARQLESSGRLQQRVASAITN